jgi:hypothetical protein
LRDDGEGHCRAPWDQRGFERRRRYWLYRQGAKSPTVRLGRGKDRASTREGMRNAGWVCCEIDANLCPKGIKAAEVEMPAISISRDEFRGQWNYAISPDQQPPCSARFLPGPYWADAASAI